jgi:alpha-amylase
VRRDLIRYLLQLKFFGYRGWRYDMVHGYHARWIAVYNRASQPSFSVGEYDWGEQAEQRGWIWHTATNEGDLTTASNVFDFSSFFTLKENKYHDADQGCCDGDPDIVIYRFADALLMYAEAENELNGGK